MPKITIKKGLNKTFTEQLTRENMQDYYTARGLVWDADAFLNRLKTYENFQVFRGKTQIGSFSLSFFEDLCLIRDLQIQHSVQGQGIGTTCLEYIQDYARANGYNAIGLRVFAENPAGVWYQCYGFVEESRTAGVIQMRLLC
ncbi:MAG: hypothetical protein CR975_04630 [Gammaproteobacteria bacterium]|nr:MAG: hypothetical protein CR975_04630 [Gammaproteobacteria bacterium]